MKLGTYNTMDGSLRTIRGQWNQLRSLSAIDFHGTSGTTTPVTIDGTIRNPVLNVTERLAAYMRFQIASQSLAHADVQDAGGGLVRFEMDSGHGLLAGDKITIGGATTNYDGNYVIVSVSATGFVVAATYVAEHIELNTHTVIGSRPIESIDCSGNPSFNALELRARLTGAAATSTFHIFGRRAGDTSVKLVASVLATAGSQKDANGYYHATTLVVTSYWPKTITISGAESGTGMATLYFDTMGWTDFWNVVTALSAGTIYFDYAGF